MLFLVIFSLLLIAPGKAAQQLSQQLGFLIKQLHAQLLVLSCKKMPLAALPKKGGPIDPIETQLANAAHATITSLYTDDNQLNPIALNKILEQFPNLRTADGGQYVGIVGQTITKPPFTLRSQSLGSVGKPPQGYYYYSAVHTYKIHLMPKKENVGDTIATLLSKLWENPARAQEISGIKINKHFEATHKNGVLPTIVIYAIAGKDAAQTLLNTIYDFFGSQEGSGSHPRYNRKTTSLIFYAQGDGDFKAAPEYAPFYEPGDDQGNGRAHFLPNILHTHFPDLMKQLKNDYEQGNLGLHIPPSATNNFRAKYEDLPFPQNTPSENYRLVNPVTKKTDD